MDLSLVYLSYVPFGISYLKEFITSYKANNSGVDHELIVLFNGHTSGSDLNPFLAILDSENIGYRHMLSPENFDIPSYFFVAEEISSKYIAFVNTYTVILHDNWLLKLYQNIIKDGVGLVGASGGWGDFPHKDEYNENLKLLLKLKISKLALKKLIFFRFNFYPRVLPTIRTTCFMMSRELFLQVDYPHIRPHILSLFYDSFETKLRNLCFEHSNHGLTRQIIRKGLKTLIVDKEGIGYDIPNWMEAKTFWVSNQENLLVSDNQTRKFQDADSETRKKLTYAAWGV